VDPQFEPFVGQARQSNEALLKISFETLAALGIYPVGFSPRMTDDRYPYSNVCLNQFRLPFFSVVQAECFPQLSAPQTHFSDTKATQNVEELNSSH